MVGCQARRRFPRFRRRTARTLFSSGLVLLLLRNSGHPKPLIYSHQSNKEIQIQIQIEIQTSKLKVGNRRSCSGVLVRIPGGEETFVLLDAGEGCVSRIRQLAPRYFPHSQQNHWHHRERVPGQSTATQGRGQSSHLLIGCDTKKRERIQCENAAYHWLLLALRAVWVSHMHADHHTGLLSLLSDRIAALQCASCSRPTEGPLHVTGPAALRPLLTAYDSVIRFGGASPSPTSPPPPWTVTNAVPGGWAPAVRGVAELSSVPVVHCRDSYGALLALSYPPCASGSSLRTPFLLLPLPLPLPPSLSLTHSLTHSISIQSISISKRMLQAFSPITCKQSDEDKNRRYATSRGAPHIFGRYSAVPCPN